MPPPGHRFLQYDRQAASLASRQEGAPRGRAVPRRGPANHRRGARQRPPARDHRFLGRRREAPARRRDHRRDRSRRRRGDRDDAGHPLQDGGKDNPQMLVAAYRQPDASLEHIDRSKAPLWIVAQALRDPGNIGTILRTGDAAGAGGLILIDDCADPFSVEAVRASMGAVFTQEIATARWGEFLAVAALRRRPARRDQPQGDPGLSRSRISPALLPPDRQRAAGPARGLRGGVRPSGQDPDGRARRQPQRRDGRGGDGVRRPRELALTEPARRARLFGHEKISAFCRWPLLDARA